MSREIDRQIAELMGYKLKQIDHDEVVEIHPVHGELCIPEFSTDWNSMRLLVEWLQGKGFKMTLRFSEYSPSWEVNVWHDENEDVDAYDINSTAPLALCKAVLSLPPEVLK